MNVYFTSSLEFPLLRGHLKYCVFAIFRARREVIRVLGFKKNKYNFLFEIFLKTDHLMNRLLSGSCCLTHTPKHLEYSKRDNIMLLNFWGDRLYYLESRHKES